MQTSFSMLLLGALLTACSDDPTKLECPAGKDCGFTAVSAGYEHTCAIYGVVAGDADDYGQVVCWGENRDGRCGAASFAGQTSAVQPVVVADLKDAVAISAGGTQTCALRADDTAVCWGGNSFGELGDGAEDGSFAPVTAKFPVLGNKRKVQIACGGTSLGGSSCVRDAEGSVWCWGRNQANQLRPTSEVIQSAPVALQGFTGAVDIAVGQDTVCAINENTPEDRTELRCVGNAFGSAPSLVAINNVKPGSLSAKGFVTCALTDNDIKCFTKFSDIVSTPIVGAIQVSAGAMHACAVDSNNDATCWITQGSPNNARLGIGSTVNPSDPTNALKLDRVQLTGTDGGRVAVEQIASGAAHTCALGNDHQIYCWGDNTKGQVGDGTQTGRSLPMLLQLQP